MRGKGSGGEGTDGPYSPARETMETRRLSPAIILKVLTGVAPL